MKGEPISLLAERLDHLEEELRFIRKELAELRQQTSSELKAGDAIWADKAAQRRAIDDLFVALSIQSSAIGAEALQQQMAQNHLDENELSKGIIEAREE